MKSFFPYYGGKLLTAKRYPPPRFRTVFEPFAGAAGYATKYEPEYAILFDLDESVCGTWDYLIRSKESEILSLPLKVTNVDDIKVVQEARWLIGWWLAPGRSVPSKVPTSWIKKWMIGNNRSVWCDHTRARLASQVHKIKKWLIKQESYAEAPDIRTTWFVDPPYVGKVGDGYTVKGRLLNYYLLGTWCKSRRGQVIVCEQGGADWLPFEKLMVVKKRNAKVSGGGSRTEMIWESMS